MRIILALIYIAFGIWIYLHFGGDKLNGFIGIAFGFAIMLSSVIVCNEGFFRIIKGQSNAEYIQELLHKNLAKTEKYNVTRAITFDDLRTGCLCHILEIGKEKTICLYGQHLYDYILIEDDPEINQDRSFPTSEFSLIIKIKNSRVLDIIIGDIVIDEIRFNDPDVETLYDIGFQLKDGEIVNNVPFENILQKLS